LLDAFVAAGLDTAAHLVFTGNGHLENELKAAAAGRSNVHLMDFRNQSEMPAVYQMADIFVSPSKGPGETWGLAINESMAAGCAIIASDKCGGAIDLVENGENGFVFRSGNRDDLAARLRQVFDNRGQLAAMKQASLAIVDKFTFTAVAAAIENTLYGKL
jgi:glycosyltransferase involved in cell wall biosynthesis